MPHQSISDHAPVFFEIRQRKAQHSRNEFPYWIYKHSSFEQYVAEELGLQEVSKISDPFHALRSFKTCMRTAAERIRRLHRFRPATAVDEEIPVVISYLRAFSGKHHTKLEELEKCLPKLQAMSLRNILPLALPGRLRLVKDFLAELYRTSINSTRV